jgi:two-component SAPR family response regulator
MTHLRVELFARTVRVGDSTIGLRPSEWDLLCALVLAGRPMQRFELAATLRPDADEDRARTAVDVRIHRLRSRLGRDVIEHTTRGYCLAETAAVDLREYEDLVRETRGPAPLTPERVQRCRSAYEAMSRWRTPASDAENELTSAVERRCNFLVRELEDKLALHALETGQLHEALSITDRALNLDACDEWAWNIAIRAHLARGDRSSALRDYRRYSSALARELDLPPSRQLHELVRCAGVPA